MAKQFLLKSSRPNPTIEFAESIEIPSDCVEIISQGGGSTIDVGKWVARKFHLKHTAIPTTAGTGSEVTKYCVLTVKGVKTTFIDEAFIPDSYVLNPRLVVSLPPLHTLASGLDVLSQAVESLWSKNVTPESHNYATVAMGLVFNNLKKCLDNPRNENARMNMLIAANFSGRAINITKTNVCHAISYPLTDWYGIPHGIACGMSLRYFALKDKWLDLSDFLLGFALPKYPIDKEKVAEEAIKSEKLADCQLTIKKEDIVKALS